MSALQSRICLDAPGPGQRMPDAEIEAATVDVPDSLVCALCSQLLHHARIFDSCGHTFCEFCMLRHDYAVLERSNNVVEYPTFQCPVCRAASVRRWFERPLNVLVNQLASEYPQHAGREADVRTEFAAWAAEREIDQYGIVRQPGGQVHVPGRMCDPAVNLARVATAARAAKAHELYNEMLPVLCDAAAEGASRVVFSGRSREMNCIIGELNRLLFRHGIHSISSTVRQTTVNITHGGSADHEYLFPNPLYVHYEPHDTADEL